jgi:hypothetical protein
MDPDPKEFVMNRAAILFLVSSFLFGCGGASMDKAESPAAMKSENAAPYDSSKSMENAEFDEVSEITAASANGPETSGKPSKAGERKIIYNATIELVVKDLQETEAKIKALVDKDGGNIAQFHQDRRYGDQLETTWRVRIPVANFESFVDTVAELGIPESRRIESEEVTEQFIDLKAGLTNAKSAEKEYQRFLEDRTKNVDEIARIYDMLRQVRKEIEKYEGQLRHLNDRIALTTVTIIAREDKEYTPPQAPNFATTIKDTFSGSLGSLKEFGKGCVLFLVAIAPWLPLALVIAIPTWHFFIRRRKSRRASQAS